MITMKHSHEYVCTYQLLLMLFELVDLAGAKVLQVQQQGKYGEACEQAAQYLS